MPEPSSHPFPSSPLEGTVVWITGLSGSGKSTIANLVPQRLASCGVRTCVLDGDDLRRGLSSDLGFTLEDRAENLRRTAEIARIVARAKILVVVALISPLARDRMRARKIINEDGLRFIEVFLDCPLAVCESRDPKGFYQKARAGRITDFTGISATYERPDQPELILNTAAQTSDQSAQELVAFIAGLPSQPHWKARSVQ